MWKCRFPGPNFRDPDSGNLGGIKRVGADDNFKKDGLITLRKMASSIPGFPIKNSVSTSQSFSFSQSYETKDKITMFKVQNQ